MKYLLLLCFLPAVFITRAQQTYVSKVHVADNGNGKYTNPILHADYSDPDAIRVGSDFYMTASSFECIPGLPILHSKDLVNWTIIGHALQKQPPFDHFSKTRHGCGVWAPAIRFHKNDFYIYYPDPDFGIYLIKAKNAAGPWSSPKLILPGKGLIDPCPLWDDNGKVYLIHAYAGSRAGIKSILTIRQLNTAGDSVLDDGRLVYDGHETDPTIEGPKLYKRNGYYYIFAPAGGVSTGWQLVLRSKNIYGPYERKVVMDDGGTPVNGPHQGAWVNTQTGEDWFLHFQDKDAYGRVVHLQPMLWKNDWPVIGKDNDGDGKGRPVLQQNKPNVGRRWTTVTPVESDEFDDARLGLQWQWMANPQANWYFTDAHKGCLRLYSYKSDSVPNLWFVPNMLTQKFPASRFIATVKMNFHPNPKMPNERVGLVVLGMSYAGLVLEHRTAGIYIVRADCKDADKGQAEEKSLLVKASGGDVWLRVKVGNEAMCTFSYSEDGITFKDAGSFKAVPGKWIGAKLGLFCTRDHQTNDSGWVDVDWFRVE